MAGHKQEGPVGTHKYTGKNTPSTNPMLPVSASGELCFSDWLLSLVSPRHIYEMIIADDYAQDLTDGAYFF